MERATADKLALGRHIAARDEMQRNVLATESSMNPLNPAVARVPKRLHYALNVMLGAGESVSPPQAAGA